MYTATGSMGENLGKFRSIKSAVKAIEESFQCNATKSLGDARRDLKTRGMTLLTSCLDQASHGVVKSC